MAISQRLHTKLVQKLILTASLQQAIKLLPMSTLELSELLNQEMVENPMLEEVPTEELQPVEASQEKQEEKPPDKEKADTWDDQDYEYFFGDYLDDGYRPRTPTEVKELPPIENTLSTAASLSDHLLWQLSMQTDEPLIRDIGEAIVGNLDDDGQLVATVEELAAMGPWPVEDVERALVLVQTFDPVGVAARDLQECLLLQLRQHGREGAPVETIGPAEKIITEHLRLLQQHQVPKLARKMGMSIDDLKQHIETIRHLDPKPGSRYNPSQSQYVIPDVYIVKSEDQYVVMLNEDGMPQLRISPVYRRLMDKNVAENTDETRAYVKDKFRSALWLIKSVEQRQKTIHKVSTSIIKFQSDFLDHGIEYLRPLVLRDVASDIGMHESTVSRVVTNKYMHTPQGVFEMKYFFHSGIASSYGEAVSSVTIKQRIRKIVEQEDSQRPLSDSRIVNILQREGLDLARRTIAKYREELKIPTSNQRKVLY
jgi:RNA polymerase sigma-54 factor